MKQQTLAMAADQGSGYEQYRKPTRRDEFLKTMETIVPWAALCEVIEPHYPKAGNGRPPIGLERMLRTTSSSTGSTWPIWPAKMPSTTVPACAALPVSIWAANPCPMPPRCSSFAAYSMTTSSVKPCLLR